MDRDCQNVISPSRSSSKSDLSTRSRLCKKWEQTRYEPRSDGKVYNPKTNRWILTRSKTFKSLNRECFEKTSSIVSRSSKKSTPPRYISPAGRISPQGESPKTFKYRIDNALLTGVRNANLDQVTKALEEGANPNLRYKDGKSVLLQAVNNNDMSITRLLVDAGADLNAKFRYDGKIHSLLDLAILMNHPTINQYLITKGAKPLVYRGQI